MTNKKLMELIESGKGTFYVEVSDGNALLSAEVGDYFIEIEGSFDGTPEPGFYDEDEMGRSNWVSGSTYFSLASVSQISVYQYSTDIDRVFDLFSKEEKKALYSMFEWDDFNMTV